MELKIFDTTNQAGQYAAKETAKHLNKIIKEKGSARIALSTGASQFPFFDEIVKLDVSWDKVEMFHLDEYIGLPIEHKASFRKYLIERFVNKVNLKKAYFVNGNGDIKKNIEELSAEINKRPIDLGLIGIGENAHIAFNDPPADFDDEACYKIVTLDEKCRKQQAREGWFTYEETEGLRAISMTCNQIMKCERIISLVPYAVKAKAIKDTLENDITPDIPSTLFKNHKNCVIICDKESASLLSADIISKYVNT